MLLTGIPYKFATPWGLNAASGFVTNPIPATTGSATAASQSLGFPPETATPVAAGGTPPDIDDFNGGFYYATVWAQWLQAGGPIQYDATLSANIGGYPNGAILSSTPPGGLWLSTADNNLSDPDTGGANWLPLLGIKTALGVNPGYEISADGTIRNFGNLTIAANTTQAITYLKPFVSGPDVCACTVGGTTPVQSWPANMNIRGSGASNTQCTISNSNAFSVAFDWNVWGK